MRILVDGEVVAEAEAPPGGGGELAVEAIVPSGPGDEERRGRRGDGAGGSLRGSRTPCEAVCY